MATRSEQLAVEGGVFREESGAEGLSIEEEFYSNAKLVGSNSLYNPGMLDDLNASTFRGSRYKTYRLQRDSILYRSGSHDEPLGQFFTFDKPVSELQTRIDKAILPKWPSGGASVVDTGYAVKLPKESIVHVGDVAQQEGIFLGGTGQIFVEKPWMIPGVEIVDEFSLQKEPLWNQVAMMK